MWHTGVNDNLTAMSPVVHEAVIAVPPQDVRCRRRSGKHLLSASISHFDPKETLALTSTPSKETLVQLGSLAGDGDGRSNFGQRKVLSPKWAISTCSCCEHGSRGCG